MNNDMLLLVDAYAQIYRAFYAIRKLTDPHGRPVNAAFGFIKMLRKQLTEHSPSHCAVAFDLGAPNKRLALLPSYKAQRPPTPPELSIQVPLIRDVLEAWRIPVVEAMGEEADDVLASLAKLAAQQNLPILIASNDKDLAQLVDENTRLLRPGTGSDLVCNSKVIESKYGVKPSQIVDYLSLIGDATDNIDGVAGIGPKTAGELLRTYGSLEGILLNLSKITPTRFQQSISESEGKLRRNQELLTLNCTIEFPQGIESLRRQSPNYASLLPLLRGAGFKSLEQEFSLEANQGVDLFGMP